MVWYRARPAVLLPLSFALLAAVLVGVAEAFLSATLYKPPHHVRTAATWSSAAPPPAQSDDGSRSCTSVVVLDSPQGERSVCGPRLLLTGATSALRSCSRSKIRGARGVPLSFDHDGGDQGGGRGGMGGGSGGGGSNDGDGYGDDSLPGDGREPLALAGIGVGAALQGLNEALRNLRLPWARKDKTVEESEATDGEASSEKGVEQELAKVLVADVVVDESVIPRDVLASAAVKSGLLGREASAVRIKACATILNQWYQYEGHILSGVSNAVISPNGTISFNVNEPVVSAVEPVRLVYYKPANITDPLSKLVQVEKGKTRAGTIAKGLGLKGGEHFKVDAERWRGVLGSGLFNGAQLAGAHRNSIDKGFTLDINVEERSTIVFEPGVTKTLFDSNWAGEICFEEKNVLGRNGLLGLNLRRSMASPFTSFSLRVGNNRFGQPGAWQVSVFRDSVAANGGRAPGAGGIGAGGGGGYADSTLGPAGSAPAFFTAPAGGVSRDLGMLARSIRGAQYGTAAAAADAATPANGDAATKKAVAAVGGTVVPIQEGTAVAGGLADGGPARCHGVSLSSSWPFSFVKATAGAGYQQVSPPTNLLKHGSRAAADDDQSGGGGGGGVGATSGDKGTLDVFSLSGGLSRDWRLPGWLRRLGSWGGNVRLGSAGGVAEGSVSSFVDVKTGCLLEGGLAPRPFAQELATLVQRMPVGPQGKAGSWNVTLNVRQQVQHCSKDTPLHQVTPFGGQRTLRGFAEGELGRAKSFALGSAEVRVPLRSLLGKLPAQAVVFLDVGAFRPVTWSTPTAPAAGDYGRPRPRGWDTARGPSGGGTEGDSVECRHSEMQEQLQYLQPGEEVSPPVENEIAKAAVAGDGEGPSASVLAPPPPPPPSADITPLEVLPAGEWRSSTPSPTPPPVAEAPGGFRVGRGQGVGLRIADLIQIDLGISRHGMKQLHIGLVDRNF